MEIVYENIQVLDKDVQSDFVLDLYDTLNMSENYDGADWSIFEVVENIINGHFDIEIDFETGEVEIFGISMNRVLDKFELDDIKKSL